MAEADRARTRQRLLSYLGQQKKLFVAGIVALLLTNICTAGLPYLTKLVFDALELAGDSQSAVTQVGWLAVGMVGLSVGLMLFRTASRVLIFDGGRRIEYQVRNDLYAHMLTLGPSFFGRMPVGDLISRTTNDITAVRLLGGPGILNLANTAIVYVVALVPMLFISTKLTVLALSPMLLLFTAARLVGPQIYKRSFKAQEELSALTSIANESIGGIQVVHAYALEGLRSERFEQGSDRYRKAYLSFILVRSVMLPIMVGMGGMGTLIILYFGGTAVIEQSMTLGDFVAFLGYLAMLMWPTVALGWMLSLWERGRAAMDRLAEILETLPDVDPESGDEDGPPLDNSIRFDGLDFGYGEDGDESSLILRDINLTIEAGERVLIVGPSGSGKSTLVSLIPHLAEVAPDSLFVGGREIHDIPLSQLRSRVAFVPQESFLFSMTLGENIGFGVDDPDPGEIESAAALAAMDADLARFPKGYETLVGERGVTLSGGQRQRMTIARAAMLKPGVWIFDDCLSSVDAGTEQRIIGALHELTSDATAIFVTHRLLGFEGVDRVVVLGEGRIVETGSHEDLLKLGGWYSRLYQRQKLDFELSEEEALPPANQPRDEGPSGGGTR